MGEKITKELLRKRAEHNDGELTTLKEVTLHQFDIEKIENLDVYCRHLEILYLQNNQIQKIENVSKLKELKYLQLAINNIQRIENLEHCESLEKLDLTVNFVEDPLDVECLKGLEFFRELYLTGNPCTQKPGYREFVITALPQLKVLDAKEITISERILARQVFDEIRERFLKERDERQKSFVPAISPAAEKPISDVFENNVSEEELEKKRKEFQNKPVAHTPEARLQAARDLEKLKPSKPSKTIKKKKDPGSDIFFAPDGRVLQKNQGKWKFKFDETPKTLILEVEISKFIDTSLLDVDVQPTYIRVTVKDKVLQLLLSEEVKTDDAICERSTASGHLVVTMLKAKEVNGNIVEIRNFERKEKEIKRKEEKLKAEEQMRAKEQRVRRYDRLFEPKEAVKINEIMTGTKKLDRYDSNIGIRNVSITNKDLLIPDDFQDDPDVPPLL